MITRLLQVVFLTTVSASVLNGQQPAFYYPPPIRGYVAVPSTVMVPIRIQPAPVPGHVVPKVYHTPIRNWLFGRGVFVPQPVFAPPVMPPAQQLQPTVPAMQSVIRSTISQ